MDHNLHTIDLGRRHVPGIHDRDIRVKEGIHCFFVGVAPPHRDTPVGVVCHQVIYAAE